MFPKELHGIVICLMTWRWKSAKFVQPSLRILCEQILTIICVSAHFFRGSYGFDLEQEFMRPLFDQLDAVFAEFEREVGTFLKTFADVANGMKET